MLKADTEIIENPRELSFFEAASIIAGLGVGGGVMAVPYLASLNGVVTIILVLLIAYSLSLLLHLMLTEIVMRDQGGKQLVETFSKLLFLRKGGGILTWILFLLVVLNFYALLTAFIIGCGEILVNLLGIPLWLAELLSYIGAAGPIFFGLKALGISEKFGITAILLIVCVLSIGSFSKPFHSLPVFHGSIQTGLALYGMVMFAFACFFSIPQVAKGLHGNRAQIPKAVATGLGINLLLVFIVTMISLLVSNQVTEMAIIGWTNSVGQWAVLLGSGFVLLAILTSYWSTSYALAIVLEDRLRWNYRICWLVGTLPTLILALLGNTGFLGFMRIAGGLLAILISIMVVPAYRGSKIHGEISDPEFKLNRFGAPLFQSVIVLAYLIVAIGSAIAL